ncbi:hypothetical protein DFH06DRAFT_1434717 [Mycena polygramma]|nr:hypothetical protein DFH06DRAFT_1434717 [Mycena polygramma]
MCKKDKSSGKRRGVKTQSAEEGACPESNWISTTHGDGDGIEGRCTPRTPRATGALVVPRLPGVEPGVSANFDGVDSGPFEAEAHRMLQALYKAVVVLRLGIQLSAGIVWRIRDFSLEVRSRRSWMVRVSEPGQIHDNDIELEKKRERTCHCRGTSTRRPRIERGSCIIQGNPASEAEAHRVLQALDCMKDRGKALGREKNYELAVYNRRLPGIEPGISANFDGLDSGSFEAEAHHVLQALYKADVAVRYGPNLVGVVFGFTFARFAFKLSDGLKNSRDSGMRHEGA